MRVRFPPPGLRTDDGTFAPFLWPENYCYKSKHVTSSLKEFQMHRFMIFTLAPLSLAGLIVLGCHSSSEDVPPTTWNDGNPWGTHHASQAAATDSPAVASAPPSTQPSK